MWLRLPVLGATLFLSVVSSLSGQAGPTPRRDIHGDPLPEGAVARLGTNHLRPHDLLRGLSFSPDGKILASAGRSGISLLDSATGKLIRRIEVDSLTTTCHFLPDGKTLVGTGPASIPLRFWDVATGKEVIRFRSLTPDNPPERLLFAVSSDGKRAAVSTVDEITVWDVSSGHRVTSLQRSMRISETHRDLLSAIGWVPGSHTLALMTGHQKGGYSFDLMDFPSGKKRRLDPEQFDNSHPRVMAFSSDGKTLALALRSGPEIRLHDLATGKAVGRLAGHREAVRDLLFSPDGEHLLSLDTGGTFILWRLRDRRELRRITAPGWLHIGIAFSPDGKTLAMPGESLEIRLREVPSLNEKIEPTPGPMNAIWPIGFAPDGKTLYSRGDALRVWDVASAKEIRPPLRHLAGLPIGLSPDGKLLAAAHFQHVVDILDAASGKQMAVISGGRWLANSWNPVGFSPDGRKLAALHARVGASIIDVRTWTRSCSIDGGKDFDFPSFSSFAFSPDSTTVALAYYNWLRLSELPSGKSRLELECAGSIDAVAFSPDGKTLTWRNQEGVLGFVEVVTGKTRKQLPKSKWADTSGIAYSPCGRLFLSGAQVWDVATGERIARGGGTPVFSADGRLLATADETAILIWETAYFLKRRPEPRALSRCEAGELFNSLKCDDAEKAHRAMERLMAAPPDSIRVLREQIRPVPTPDKGQTLKLIATLSSDQYAERQRASTELAQFGEAGWPILESQLKSALSLETRRRIELLLQESSKISPDYLRDMRAMEILERIGSPDAVQILEDVATGCPTLRRTREAKACLARLAKFAK